MAGARMALRGWRKAAPANSRLPLPYEVVMMLANFFLHQHMKEQALLTLIMFNLYLRPSEPHRLQHGDIIAPVAGSGARHFCWAVTLHPWERGTPSKTLEFDESLLIDQDDFAFLGPALARLRGAASAEKPLFKVTQAEYARSLAAATQRLGVAEICSYQLRHSGASHDAAMRLRSLAEIQRRGRWRAQSSCRRYEKGGRVTEQLRALKPHIRAHAVACAQSIERVVRGLQPPLPPPSGR